VGAARNGRKNEREKQHHGFHKCDVHIDSRTCREVKRMKSEETICRLIETK
jgi:hypothetical protein